MHEVGADEVEVQLAQRGQLHIRLVHHAAGHDARFFHDAVRCHAKFLHIGQVGAVFEVGAGDGAHLRHPLA